MLHKEVIKQIFSIIKIEYSDFIPKEDIELKSKLDLWFEGLKNYPEEEVRQATKDVLYSHIYGMPKVSNIISTIEKNRNKDGMVFKNRILQLLREKDVYHMEEDIRNEFGEIGVKIYKGNYYELATTNCYELGGLLDDLANIYNQHIKIVKLKTIKHENDPLGILGTEDEKN